MGREPIAALEARTGSSPARLEGACRACRRRRLTTCSVPAVEWHGVLAVCSWTVLSPLRRRCAVDFAFSSGKFRAAVVASLRGRCPSKPSSPAVCLRSERSEVRRATHVRPVSWHLCFRPRQLPREGTCSSSSHASPLLLPSGHLVVPLSHSISFPSPCSCLYGGLLVCF